MSVVIYVVKGDFVPLSATRENPANAGVARLSGVSHYSVPDTATALPKQARYQLRYTRISLRFAAGRAAGGGKCSGQPSLRLIFAQNDYNAFLPT